MKTIVWNDNRIKSICVLTLMIILMLYISITLSSQLHHITKDIKDMYLCYFSYTFINESFSSSKIIISALNTILIVSIFADNLSLELEKNAAYIFTRTKKIKKWLTNKLIYILCSIIKIQFCQFIIAFGYFGILGYRINNVSEFIQVILKLFILIVSTQYIAVIIANLVSLKTNQVIGYIVSISLIIINLIIFYSIYFTKRVLIGMIPFTQYMITIQDTTLVNRSVRYFSHYIKNYYFIHALIFNIVFIIILFVLGRRSIEKHEFY
ncbi:hypothetical protein [Inconstantimicrobium mannanitabidum]|uniref:Uncharacterized protein n=1 Tax=Inconstantimicrobium mannanitabidum TaxID=1604901 RepID=A0ACB5RBT3_9CLOT|nr:hypothetical protein [Clostridium sp. TW13]GKX66712.1 hypothetical protein rsdtw13_19700 [Clostridium sp. TW13]